MPVNNMKKIIIIVIIIFAVSLIAGNILSAAEIKIENKTLTLTQYSILKNGLIDKYKTKGFFTVNEWQTYMIVLKQEAKDGKLKNLPNITKQNLISKINEKIYTK